MRKIPVTMATQHPDNIYPAYFNNNAFINTTDEIEEAYLSWSELWIHEYMWDWEWKFVDEAVVDKLFRKYHEYFKKNQLWRDMFLTYRIPNIWQESGYRLMRAFMNIISIAEFSKEMWYDHPPVFEIILPMTETSDQMIYLKEKFKKLALMMPDLMEHGFHNADFHIEVIPLFEEVMTMINSVSTLEKYAEAVTKMSWKPPEYLRVFLARSDPAMNIWIIPSVLWVKVAINNYKEYEKKSWIKIYPWLWAGSLPFRWNVSPDRINDTILEYKWLDSVTVQSSFRYDHDLSIVKQAIDKLNEQLPKNREKYIRFTNEEAEQVKNICTKWFEFYTKTIEKIAWVINDVARLVPKRRERMQHVWLFGYSRGIWEIKLPRAIWFTASLYSIWVPPEFIGTWRLINYLIENNLISSVEKWYLNLKKDLAFAYKFLNKENLEVLSKTNEWFKGILEDVKYIENYLWDLAKNDTLESITHRNETSSVLHLMLAWENFEDSLVDAAKIRKSLG